MVTQPRRITWIVIAALLISATPGTAGAAPLASKKAQAAAIKKQIDKLDTRLEIAVENYDKASSRYTDLKVQVAGNRLKLRNLNRRVGKLQKSLGSRADSMYRNGPSGTLELLLGVRSFADLATTWDLLNRFNDEQSAIVAELQSSQAMAKRYEKRLETLRASAKGTYIEIKSRRTSIENQLATRKRLLKGVETEVAQLEAEQARKRSAARGNFAAMGWDWGSPTNAPRSEVIDIAKRYLGAPYVWAAAGPNSFDCSGFTMFVYAQFGVSLPHYSGDQIGYGQRVPYADLKPGDLVFFGSPIHHVGIYAGNNQMIDAPHSGAVVRYDNIWSDYAGACRP